MEIVLGKRNDGIIELDKFLEESRGRSSIIVASKGGCDLLLIKKRQEFTVVDSTGWSWVTFYGESAFTSARGSKEHVLRAVLTAGWSVRTFSNKKDLFKFLATR